MKKIFFLVFILVGVKSFSQLYTTMPQRYDFKDSVKFTKLKNNNALDSILSTDINGRIIQVKKPTGGGGGGSTTVSASAPLSITGSPSVNPNVVADTTTAITGLATKGRVGKMITDSLDALSALDNALINADIVLGDTLLTQPNSTTVAVKSLPTGYGTTHTVTDSTIKIGVDSLQLSTRAWRQKGIDSLGNIKLNISDTAAKWITNIHRIAGRDSIYFTKGGVVSAIKDSTGGAAPTQDEYLGVIYNNKNWADLSDFVNTTSVIDSAGHLVFTGGSSDFTHTLNINKNQRFGLTNYFTNPEKWRMAVKVKVITAGVVGIGVRSSTVNSPASGAFAYLNTGDGSTYFTTPSASNLSISLGDVIEIIAERNIFNTSISVRNITTNSATIQNVGNYLLPSQTLPVTGQFAIFNYSGKFYVDSISVDSKQQINADLLVIGDSKTQGYNGNNLNRFTTQLNDSYSTISYGGGYETTADWLTTINDVINLDPKNVLLTNPSNDLRTSVNTDSTKARYYRIENAFRTAGINVYHSDGFYETAANNAAWATYINSTRSVDSIIATYEATKINGVLDADNTHPTPFGDSIISKTIVSSGKIKAAINTALAPTNFIQNQSYFVQSGKFWVDGISTISNKTIIGKASLENSLRALRIITGTSLNIHIGGAGGENNIISSNDNEDTPKKLNIKTSALDLVTYDGSNHTASFATNGDVTLPAKLYIGNTGLTGSVYFKGTGATNETIQQFYNGATNNIWFADNGLSDGRFGAIRGKTLVLGNYNGSTYDALTIASSGNIGINKSAPSWGFDINRKVGLNKDSIPISAANLSALSLDTTTGQIVRTVGAGSSPVTSVSGTTNRITSTGGATPVIDISSAYVGQSSITTLGTITTGVWNGTAIANANLANGAVANLSGTNSGDNAVNSLYSGLVSNATHTGDATGSTALTVKGINGQLLSTLATGILKNTTTTGVPTIAVAGTDYVATESDPIVKAISGIVKSNGTTIAAAAGSDLNTTFGSQTANFIYAAPSGSAGNPSFRAMTTTDVPTLNQSTTGSAASLTTGRTIAITGDLAYTSTSFNGTANVTAAGTLATVNANVGSFGSSTAIPSFTVNGKGLITAASTNAVIAPAGTLTGSTLNSTVTASSLTSVGTVTTGTLAAGAIIQGVTMTLGSDASYDTYYRNASGVLTRLGNGTTGQVLTATTSAAPSWSTVGGTGDVVGPVVAVDGQVTLFNGITGKLIKASAATGLMKTTAGVAGVAVNSDLPVMTATVGGAVPTPPNNTTTFLRGDGTFATPASGTIYYAPSVLTANSTDANYTAVVNSIVHLPAATLTANRTFTMPTGANGDVIKVVNDEAGFTWTVSGSIYYSDGTTTVTTLLGQTTYIIEKIDGKWRITN